MPSGAPRYLGVCLVLVGALAPTGAAVADEAPPKPAATTPAPAVPPGDEPELEGDAKKQHEKEVKAVLERLRNDKNREDVRMAIERLGASGTRASRDALIAFATGNKNQEFLKYAFDALAKIGNKKAIEFLCGKSAVRSGDFLVALSAAEALEKAKSPLAVGPLLDVLTAKDTKSEVMGAVARAAAKSGPSDERVVDTIFQLVENKKDTVRAGAMEALGYVASDKAVARLRDAMVGDKNTRVRGAAATGLENSGRKDQIPVLQKALEAETALTVRAAIGKAIQTLMDTGR